MRSPSPSRPCGRPSPSPLCGPIETRLADSLVADAVIALERGRPWQASRLIAVVLSDSTRRTPNAVMLAATAASRWGGWPEVTRLLDGQPWVDSAYNGEGRLLLARAALQQGSDSVALRHVLAAPSPNVAAADGERLVLLATALERLHARDSAAASYVRAAERLPSIAGWLRIRAAAVTDDGLDRARLYQRVTDPLARDRIDWSEAAAHTATGDLTGAAVRYAALGARATALRLRLASRPDSASRAVVRRDLVALVAARRSPVEVRDAIALLDSAFAPLTPAEELEVGRAAATAGSHTRSVAAFERGLGTPPGAGAGTGLGTAEDRFAYATGLTRLGRHADAAPQFALVRGPRGLAASAAYQRARALVRSGQEALGRTALTRVVRLHSRDTTAASSALFLLGDLASDDRADARARGYYRQVVARYPSSRFAPTAAFRAATIALLAGDAGAAAVEFDSLAKRYPRSDEAGAATYWAGPRLVRRGRHRHGPRPVGAARHGGPRLLLHRPCLPPARSARVDAGRRRGQLRPDPRCRQRYRAGRAARAPRLAGGITLGVRPARPAE